MSESSDESDGLDVGVVSRASTASLSPWDHLEDAGRQTRLEEQFGKPYGHRGSRRRA